MSGEGYAGAFINVSAAAFFVMNPVTAYKIEGGGIGQVPVMAPPVSLSAYAIGGLALVDRDAGGVGGPVWGYLLCWLCWLAVTAAAWRATTYAGERGKR